MVMRYKVIWVDESTRKLAKELSGKSGIAMKDYIKLALEKTKSERMEIKKRNNVFDFKL